MTQVGLGHCRGGEDQLRLLDDALPGGDDLRRSTEVDGRYLHLLLIIIVATPAKKSPVSGS